MIKKIVVYLLLFSFMLGYFPQAVFAAAYTQTFGQAAASSSTWSLNQAVAGGITNMKIVTNALKDKDGQAYKFLWQQDASGEFYRYNSLTGAQTGKHYTYRLHNYSVGTGATQTVPSPYPSDIYMLTQGVDSSSGGLLSPSIDTNVFKIVHKTGSTEKKALGLNPECIGSKTICLESPGGSNEILIFKELPDTDYKPSTPNNLINAYINDAAIWSNANHPKITSGKLSAADIALCKDLIIEPDSSNDWILLDALKDETNDFSKRVAEELKKSGATETTTGKVFDTTPFRDDEKDIVLYKKYYSDIDYPPDPPGPSFYPNKVPNSGDALDAVYAQEFASVWEGSTDDYSTVIPGTNITWFSAAETALGVVGLYTAGNTVNKVNINYIKPKVGEVVAKRTAARAMAKSEKAAKLVSGIKDVATHEKAMAAGKQAAGAFDKALDARAAATAAKGASAAMRFNAIAITGTIAIYGAMNGVSWFVNQKNKAYYTRVFEMQLAALYAASEMEFAGCIMDNVADGKIDAARAAGAGFSPETIANGSRIVLAMTEAAISGTADAIISQTQTADDDICGSLLDVKNIINWVFCQTFKVLYIILKWFVTFAEGMALRAIGLDTT